VCVLLSGHRCSAGDGRGLEQRQSRSLVDFLFGGLMPRDFTTRKRAILGGIICLVLADLALAYYNSQLASETLTTPEQFSKQEMGLKKLEAPIARARKIREEMQDSQRECERFVHMI